MLNMQNVKDIEIPEGDVRTIHDKDNCLIWGRLAYDTKYAGDTYQQTYSGKNLAKVTECNISTSSYSLVISNGSVDINSITSNNWFDICGGQRTGDWVPTNVASVADYNLTSADEGTYVLSIRNFSYTNTANQNAQIHVVTNQRRISTAIARGATSFEPEVFTLEAGEHVKMIGVWLGANGTAELKGEFQLELGSAPTSYEPYTGGIPAPNPDYPQAVQVVTGEQTVTISDGVDSKDFTISLGSNKFCKIGNYQDYIYNSGDDWYVHKECGKAVFDGTESWSGGTSTGSPTYLYAYTTVLDSLNLYSVRQAFCSHFTIEPNQLATGTEVSYPCMSVVTPSAATYAHIRLMIPLAIAANTNALRTWLGSHNTNLYYVLATSTDTKITDATLIGQLDAVHEWLTRYGYNATVSGNLPIIINQTNL